MATEEKTTSTCAGISIKIDTDQVFIPYNHPKFAEIQRLSEDSWFKHGDMGTTGKLKMLIGEEHLKQGIVIQRIVDYYIEKERSIASQQKKEHEKQLLAEKEEKNRLLQKTGELQRQLYEEEQKWGMKNPNDLPEDNKFVPLKSLKFGGGIDIVVNKDPKRYKGSLHDVRLGIRVGSKVQYAFIKQDEMLTVLKELHSRYLLP
jgi:hypothetical protein